MIRSLKLSAPLSSSTRGEGLNIKSVVDACDDKVSIKNPWTRGFRELLSY
jgi:hypothetical protein